MSLHSSLQMLVTCSGCQARLCKCLQTISVVFHLRGKHRSHRGHPEHALSLRYTHSSMETSRWQQLLKYGGVGVGVGWGVHPLTDGKILLVIHLQSQETDHEKTTRSCHQLQQEWRDCHVVIVG